MKNMDTVKANIKLIKSCPKIRGLFIYARAAE